MVDDQSNSEEEQLNISGTDTPSINESANESESADDDFLNDMQPSLPDLAGISVPGETNDEFLEKLLQTSPDQLIPWEDCHLPSKGLYYENWEEGGLVKVRAMGQTAEKILATQRLAQSGQSMDYLFRECCQFQSGFDPVNLLLGDRVFLLYFLRGITHGNVYEFAFTCPNPECESITTHRYDLNELSRTISWAEEGLGEEPFKIELPYLTKATGRSVWVSARFLRSYDSNDIIARQKAKKSSIVKPGGVRTRARNAAPQRQKSQNQQLDDSITENLDKAIVNVMGSEDRLMIRSFIQRLHATDTAAIREWLREHTPGIDSTVYVSCPDCSVEHTVELPITDSFFRPSKS